MTFLFNYTYLKIYLICNAEVVIIITTHCTFIALKYSVRSAITRAAMQSLENQIWRSRLTISTKLKLYNTCILPIFLYGSDCWAISKTDTRKIDALDQWCLRMLIGIKWYQFVWNDDVRRLTKQPKLTAIIQSNAGTAYPILAYYAHGRQRRCQEDPVSLPSGRLEKTTRSSPHHVAQHRPTGSETTPPYAPQSSRFGSVEDDVDVWLYAILELHARNDDDKYRSQSRHVIICYS